MVPRIKLLLSSGLLLMLVFGCSVDKPEQSHVTEVTRSIPLHHAKRFEIWKSGDITNLKINTGNPGGDSFTYALIPHGTAPAKVMNVDQTIEVPVRNLVVTSTSHLPFLDLLDVSDRLVGFPNTNYVSSPAIRARIDQGLVKEIGDANGLDAELLIDLQPDLVISYTSGADRSELDKLAQSGIPTVINLDFLENTPLGRAEWIKFMGLFLGKYPEADSVFFNIEQRYQNLRSRSRQATTGPEVFSGIVYGDTWFAPGGNSFVAKFIDDAGGIYTWNDYLQHGSIELSFEAVLDRNRQTEFWIGSGGFTTKAELLAADPRYAYFKAFQTDRIYNYHGRIGNTGGFEYLETGGARPDLVLADFIKILHPEVIPEHEPYFFKRLN